MEPIVRTALVGTAKAPGAPAGSGLPVDPLVAGVEGDERRLLLVAGAGAVYRVAGRAAPAAPPVPDPAPEDPRPPCSPVVSEILGALLQGEHAELLPEACARLDRAGRRLPHSLLPEALALEDESFREALRPVLGERGVWLARFNPDWSWALPATPEAAGPEESLTIAQRIWEEGSFKDRVAVLTAVRAADPARAREWLEPVFAKEKADERGTLLAVLGTRLGPDDEPFLEKALGDRSAAVRNTAAGLLAHLPESALAGRMRARAEALLVWEPPPKPAGLWGKVTSLVGAGGKGKLLVTPPQEIDRTWERDGIAANPPQGVGKRAFWTGELLALVPPGHWTERFQAAPADLLAAARETEWAVALLDGWARAAVDFHAVDWAMALWDAGRSGLKELGPWLPDLLAVLPPEEVAVRVERLLATPPPIEEASLQEYLRILPTPWSPAFAAAYLTAVRRAAAAVPPGFGQADPWRGTLAVAARALPEEAFAAALDPWPFGELAPEDWMRRSWAQEVERFTEVVRIRQTLQKETVP